MESYRSTLTVPSAARGLEYFGAVHTPVDSVLVDLE